MNNLKKEKHHSQVFGGSFEIFSKVQNGQGYSENGEIKCGRRVEGTGWVGFLFGMKFGCTVENSIENLRYTKFGFAIQNSKISNLKNISIANF